MHIFYFIQPPMTVAICRLIAYSEGMTLLFTAADIERMAHEQGLTMAEVNRRAGLKGSIFTRWKSGETAPNTRTYQRFVDVVYVPTPEAANDRAKPKRRQRAAE